MRDDPQQIQKQTCDKHIFIVHMKNTDIYKHETINGHIHTSSVISTTSFVVEIRLDF